MTAQHLLLASQSPRRRELLTSLGVPFEAFSVDLDETPLPQEAPRAYVQRLAIEKASAGFASRPELTRNAWVMGSDTTVVADNQVLGKPEDIDDFRRMMKLLSGQLHEVLTSVAITNGDRVFDVTVSTVVYFSPLSDSLIDAYWKTGEPQDKAGGYGIQGKGSILVERIEGSFSNVVGLPLRETAQLLAKAGFLLWDETCRFE